MVYLDLGQSNSKVEPIGMQPPADAAACRSEVRTKTAGSTGSGVGAVRSIRSMSRAGDASWDPSVGFQGREEEKEFGMAEEDHFGSGFVLHEGNCFRHVWSVIVCCLLTYTATFFLFRLCFCTFHINEDGPDPIGLHDWAWVAADVCVDVLFWVDLFVNFFLSYRTGKGVEVDSLRLIARRYMRCYFWVNLVACLPEQLFEVMLTASIPQEGSGKLNKLSRLGRLQRMSRLSELVRLMKVAGAAADGNFWQRFRASRGVRVINFIVGLLWTMHFVSCFWYLCAALHKDPKATWVGRREVDQNGTSLLSQGPFEQWLVAMYFVLTVFTTVGFGDISAGTEGEILFVGFTMVAGAVVHSIIISEVITTITNDDQVHKYIKSHHELIDAFCDHVGMPASTRQQVKDEMTWRCQSQHQRHFDKDEMAKLIGGRILPWWLLTEMSANLFDGCLERSSFISCCYTVCYVPPRLPLLLACKLSRLEFEAGEVVYQFADFPFNLFLVHSGSFAFVARPSDTGGIDQMMIQQQPPEPPSAETPSRRFSIPGATTFRSEGTEGDDGARPCVSGLSVLTAGINILRNASRSESHASVLKAHQHTGLYPYRLFGRHSYFGDTDLLQGHPRAATARCERMGTALVLHRSDLAQLQEQFPQFRAAWLAAALRRDYFRRLSCRRLTRGLPLRHFAAFRIQCFVRAVQLATRTGTARRRKSSVTGKLQSQLSIKQRVFQAARMAEVRHATHIDMHQEMLVSSVDGKDSPAARLSSSAAVEVGGKQTLEQVQQLRESVDSLRGDFVSFRREMRELLQGKMEECTPPGSADMKAS